MTYRPIRQIIAIEIMRIDEENDVKSIEDMLAGREVLLDLVEQKRLDRAAVQAAIVMEDWKQVAALLDPDYVDKELMFQGGGYSGFSNRLIKNASQDGTAP